LQSADARDYFLQSGPTGPQVATPGAESAVYDCLFTRVVQLERGSPTLSTSMLRRQRGYQTDNEFGVCHPKHLSLPSSARPSVADVNETILSIISDSSNHINYA